MDAGLSGRCIHICAQLPDFVRFVMSLVKSNFTSWFSQNLSRPISNWMMGYWWTIKKVCYFVFKRGLKQAQVPKFHIFGRHFNTWNSKTRQMSKCNVFSIFLCPTYCVQQNTVSTFLLLIYTCTTFPCWHATVVLYFALHSPLFCQVIEISGKI